MKILLVAFLFFLCAGFARADANPPEQIDRTGYENWLSAINSNQSAFLGHAFDWVAKQLQSPLPAEVAADPDKIYVAEDEALQQTIDLENSGDIDIGTTVGFDAYALVDANVDTVLQAKLFGWGKPIGQAVGTTYPFDSVFSHCQDSLAQKWGPNNFFSSVSQTGGGIAKDLHDNYSVLLRGDSKHGYVLYVSFFSPNGITATTSHMSIMLITPTAGGKTEYRQFARQNGQSYAIFGLDFGRKNFGFNVARVHKGEVGFLSDVAQLKATGQIKENKP